jgi:hypothetical protein
MTGAQLGVLGILIFIQVLEILFDPRAKALVLRIVSGVRTLGNEGPGPTG